MNTEVITLLDELIDIIDNSEEMKRLTFLKNKIYQDSTLKEELDKIKKIDNIYSSEYLNLKKEILGNELVREYKTLENNFLLLSMGISNKLKKLTGERGGCHADN